MLETIFAGDIYRVLLVFTRVGTLMMLLPGVGESYVSVPARLGVALLISLLVTPVILPLSGVVAPSSVGDLLRITAGEFLVGLFMGTLTRTMLAAMSICGTVVAFSTGFSNAFLFNPTLQDQGVIHSVFFTLLGVLMIFVTNTHHLFIMAVIDSYNIFAPGQVLTAATTSVPGDMANAVVRYTADSFNLGVRMSMPFLLVMLVMYLLLAVLARVMPQFQVFFVAIPAQVIIGVLITLVVISSIMLTFIRSMQNLAGEFSVI